MIKSLDKPVEKMTLQDLQDIVRQIIREELSSRWRIDDEGNIIFLYEEDYIDYLDKRKGEIPSEINAFFVNDQGFTVRYADEILTSKAKKRIEKAKQEIADGKGLTLSEVKQRINAR
jgi:basic membrane lipoprotein Med (substrate-binding protein (PBP1-ABC) superfamily)